MSTETAPTTSPPIADHSDKSALYRLVQAELIRAHAEMRTDEPNLIGFIMERRKTPTVGGQVQKPVPFYTIAQELKTLTKVHITHEAVRRWHRAAEREALAAAQP